MKKIFSLMAAALVSLSMVAGPNDLLWDYTQEKIPTTSPDNGLYYSGYVNDAPSTNNALNGVKLNSSGWAYFEKAEVAGKLKLTFANRKAQTAYAVSVYNGTKAKGEDPVKGTKIIDTDDIEFGASTTIDLPAEVKGVYIERKTGAEGVLSRIEFKENVERTFVDFKIEFRDNPYTVLLPTTGELPEGVVVAGITYNGGQHGIYGGSITVPVDGTIKFTIGGCQYSSSDITVKKDGEVYATVSNAIAACGKTTGVYEEDVPYIYMGGAGVLTFEIPGNAYIPYFFAEAAEITPCEIIFKDQNGKELGKVETIEGATLDTLPDVSVLPAIAEGMAFRGWFYGNGKKAQLGDAITGNTIIRAKVTPIEVATEGSVFTYNFADQTFYPEDHELLQVSHGAWHDGTHGWYFDANGMINVYSPGTSVVVVTLCKYSESGTVEVNSNNTGHILATQQVVKNETPDGTELVAQYSEGPGWVNISWDAKQYIHKVVVYNVAYFLEPDENTGYYILPAGDAASLILSLVQAPEGAKIFLPNGTYDMGETVLTTINKNNISLIGESMEGVIIKNAPNVATESIDKTATIKINDGVSGTYLQDLTIQNALDYYKADNGRAVCLWDRGTKTVCKNVRLLSYQDTYYSNKLGAVKYFEDCEIHGTVDYICGDGNVYFKNNLLYCEKRKKDGGGSDCITASNADASDFGYAFEGCTIKSECPVVSFGRAWNNTPMVTFINTLVDYSAGEFVFTDNGKIQRWTKELMNKDAWPIFGEYNTHLADGTVLTPEHNVVTFIDTKNNNATQDKETVLTEDQVNVRTIANTLGEWGATAVADATQAKVDLNNIDPDGIYLIENPSGYYEVTIGAWLGTDWSLWGEEDLLRKANARGGFGPAVCPRNPKEAIDNTAAEAVKTQKIVREGQLIIVRDGKEYNVLGTQL